MEFIKFRPDIQSLIDEFVKFRVLYCALECKCRNMEEQHHLDIVDINRDHADQIIRMEDEIELLRSQSNGLEQLHREEIARIEKRNEKEKLNLEQTINRLKNEVNELKTALKMNIELTTTRPMLYKSKAINPNKSKSKKPSTSAFKWPSLDVEISTTSNLEPANTKNANKSKKRKLYTIDKDEVVDLIS